MRSRYVDSPQAAMEAAATWKTYTGATTAPGSTTVLEGRQREALEGAAREVARFRAGTVPGLSDEGVRRAVARDVAGLLAVVAQKVEPQGRGPWMRATDAVMSEAKSTEKGAGTVRPLHSGLARAARLIGQAGSADAGLGWSAVLDQLGRTVEALAEADIARAQGQDAAYLRGHASQVLAGVGAGQRPAAPAAAPVGSRRESPFRLGVEKGRQTPGPGR